MQVSLEPPRLLAGDGLDDDLFARPARLQDLNLEDGREVLTRDDQTKSLHDRLMRLWAERGDFSRVTADSIKNPATTDAGKDEDAATEEKDGRPAVEDIRKLQETMLHSLALVRGELTTALDLLSVLSTPTDPPDVDVNSIPLPQQTLTLVPTAPPPRASSDPAKNPLAVLPVATSLTALKSSANAFFRASEELIPLDAAEQAALVASAPSLARPRAQTRAPDPWPTILRLHASSPRRLVPLGAGPGASLTGKGETRAARQVGVVYGCPEAREDFRRAAVARVGELVDQVEAARKDGAKAGTPRGRSLVLELESKATRASWCWSGESDSNVDGNMAVERMLQDRARSALGEELFAQLVQEARSDQALRAELVLGDAATGDKVRMQGTGWTLSISMSRDPPSSSTSDNNASEDLAALGPLLRLFTLQSYAYRRSPQAVSAPRPLLATVSAVLNHQQRASAVSAVLERQLARVEATALPVELVLNGKAESVLARSVQAALSPSVASLGGRATLRIDQRHAYHVTHAYPLPRSKSALAVSSYGASGPGLTEPSLTLRSPGKQPIAVPSLRLLEQLLSEQVSLVIAASSTAGVEVESMQS